MAITRPYTAHEWETGDVITEERMNIIEKGIEAIDTEVFGARGYGTSSDNSLGSRIDDMIIISDSEPTSVNNEIWVKGENEQVEIPTYEEFEKLRDSIAKAYDATATYKVGDYVLYDTKLYCCTTVIDNAELWNTAHWAKVTIANEVADLKNDLSNEIGYKSGNMTIISEDGSTITELYDDGGKKISVFSENTVTETYYSADNVVKATKTVVFDNNIITATVA